MDGSSSPRRDAVRFVLAGIFIAAVGAYLLVLFFAGADAARLRLASVLLLVAALLVGLGALYGWHRDRRLTRAAVEAERQATEDLASAEAREAEVRREREALETTLAERQSALEESRREADERASELESRGKEHDARVAELEEKAAEGERALERERALRSRVERARQAEREWTRELREQVMSMHRERGALANTDDVRVLVLHAALTLAGAEKGLLLSRKDEDDDGQLDFIASEGFDNDPTESAVAQRFSRQVIERDTTVREEAPSELEGNTSADDEIENLVAIPIYLADRFSGVVVCANNPEGFGSYDDQVLLSVGDHAGAVLQNSLLHGELRSAYVATVRMLAETIEAKDPFLRGHSEEVSDYVAAVSAELSLDPARREELLFGSLLHDVGKIGISERILLKPGPLTPEERTICELHPRIGYRLVQQVPALAAIAPAILHHHERFDGDGYPSGLRGEQIPLEARVVSVADSFAAMTADRPYKSRMSVEDACTELERCAGSQFDPEVVRIFVQAVRTRPSRGAVSATAEAFDDPELALRREGDEPVLGSGSFAITDNLTLLYSHRYLHEVAEAEAQRAEIQTRPFSVVMLEMAEIDSVNSREGYAAGDEAIKAVARTVQAVALRAAGTGARYGGRRLALLASSVDRDGAARLAREIEAEAAGGPAVRITTATWSPGDSGADILARARAALVSPGAGARVPGASEPFSPPA